MVRRSLILVSLFCAAACAPPPGTSTPDPIHPTEVSPPVVAEPDSPRFEPLEHPIWQEPAQVQVPRSFAFEGEGQSPYHARLREGARFPLAASTKRACGAHVQIVRRGSGTVTFQEFTGGFAFRPEVDEASLAADVVVGPTLLYDPSGHAFALLGSGTQVEIVSSVDETWSEVRLTSRPDLNGLLRRGRIGSIYDGSQHVPGVDGLEVIALQPDARFDLLDEGGEVRLRGIRADHATVLSRQDARLEIIVHVDLSAHPLQQASVELHGFVKDLPESESFGTRAWTSVSAQAPAYRVVPGAWLHAAPDASAKSAQAAGEHADVTVVERGPQWTEVEADTLWGPARGFVRSVDLEPRPEQDQWAEQGRLGRCLQPEEA